MRRLSLVTCFVLAVTCAPPPEREITVGMGEYAFLPAIIEVGAGERVRFVFRNTGRLEHDFATDDRGRALGLMHVHLAPGASSTLDWTAPAQPAEVRILCTIVGHETLGMTGKLVVKARG
jgi:uncharacterized cupredoxin-like copper-binding protein